VRAPAEIVRRAAVAVRADLAARAE
jgi:hypothetical protein